MARGPCQPGRPALRPTRARARAIPVLAEPTSTQRQAFELIGARQIDTVQRPPPRSASLPMSRRIGPGADR